MVAQEQRAKTADRHMMSARSHQPQEPSALHTAVERHNNHSRNTRRTAHPKMIKAHVAAPLWSRIASSSRQPSPLRSTSIAWSITLLVLLCITVTFAAHISMDKLSNSSTASSDFLASTETLFQKWSRRKSKQVERSTTSSLAAELVSLRNHSASDEELLLQSSQQRKKKKGWLFSRKTKRNKLASVHSSSTNASEKTAASVLHELTQPYFSDDAWLRLTGNEWKDHAQELLGPLTATGQELALNDQPNEWINWKPYGSYNTDKDLTENGIHVWTGRPNRKGNFRHGNIAMIKTRAIIPLSAQEFVEHLLDNDKITTYNPYSLGRVDKWNSPHDHHRTKIVRNEVKSPVGTGKIISTTLVHARPAPATAGKGAWIYLSRAVGGSAFAEPGDAKQGVTENVLGANVVQPIDDTSCLLSCVSHGYASPMPNFLAERLQVKGAIKFI